MGRGVASWANGPWKDVNDDRGDYLQTQTYLEEGRSVVVYRDLIYALTRCVQGATYCELLTLAGLYLFVVRNNVYRRRLRDYVPGTSTGLNFS